MGNVIPRFSRALHQLVAGSVFCFRLITQLPASLARQSALSSGGGGGVDGWGGGDLAAANSISPAARRPGRALLLWPLITASPVAPFSFVNLCLRASGLKHDGANR